MLTPAQQKREQDKKDKYRQYWQQIIDCGMLECRVCHILLSLDNFTRELKRSQNNGYLIYCKECKSCRSKRNINDRLFVKTSLEDVLSDRLYASSVRAVKKKLSFDLDLPFLFFLWENQKSLCYYTNKPMRLEINSPDKVSIDRLDSSKGYTQDNVVLCRNVINYLKGDLLLDDFKQIILDCYTNFISNN